MNQILFTLKSPSNHWNMILEIALKSFPLLRCQKRYKKFSESSCLLSISVGQPAHESIKFERTLELIDRSFQSCTICVGDTLQRFTLAIHKKRPPNEMALEALFLGNQWIQRNLPLINQLHIPHKIIRWDDYLNRPTFKEIHALIATLYHQNQACKKAFDTASNNYLERFFKENSSFLEVQLAQKHCTEYLIEESSVLYFWAQDGYDFDVYPGQRNEAMDYVHKNFVRFLFSNKATSVYLKGINFIH